MNTQAETPRFSVIIPLFNCERYICDCLDSLTRQTEQSFEAIVVDDGSTDDGLRIARAAFESDGRFTFLQNASNLGPSASRNRALDAASGTFIIFLDADDLLTSDALSKIARRFDDQNLDDLFFNGHSFYENVKSAKRVYEDFSRRPSFDGVATGKEVFVYFEQANEYYPQAAMHAYRRSFLESNHLRFREGIIHEDVLFTFQALVASERCSFLNEPIYLRRIHLGSIMAQPRRTMRNIEGHLIGIHFMQQWLQDNYASKSPEELTDLDTAFMQATCHRCDDYLWLCAKDYCSDISPEEKVAHLASLTPAQRLRFEQEVAQLSLVYQRFYNSRVHQIGERVCVIPKALQRIKTAITTRKMVR